MTLANANLLAQDVVARWIIENSPKKLQIAKIWPFMGVPGGAQLYNRWNVPIGNAARLSDGTAVSPVEDDDELEQQSFSMFEFITRYQINTRDLDLFHQPTDPEAASYALALRRLLYGYFAWLDGEDGTQGLIPSIPAGQTIDRGGSNPLTLEALDEAFHLVSANDGKPTVIMSGTRALRTYAKLCRDKGYDVPMIPWQWYNPGTGGMEESWVESFNGVPWLINGVAAGDASATAALQRIYFMAMGDDGQAGPTRGVTGIVPEDLRDSMFIKRQTHGVPVNQEQIIQVDAVPEELHIQPTIDVQTIMDTWVSWPVGVAIGSQGAISLIHNFTVVADV